MGTVEAAAQLVSEVIFNEVGGCQAVSLFLQDYVNEKVWRAGCSMAFPTEEEPEANPDQGSPVEDDADSAAASPPPSPPTESRDTSWDLGCGIVGKSIELGHPISAPYASACEFFDARIDSVERTSSQWRIPGAILSYPFKSVSALEEIRDEEEKLQAIRKKLREEKAFEEQLIAKTSSRRAPERKRQAEIVVKLEKEVDEAERNIARLTLRRSDRPDCPRLRTNSITVMPKP